MDFEILNWLKNFDFVDYFGIVRHTVKYDNSIWELDEILDNLNEGFTTIKCNACDKNSTWINFAEKIALCGDHIKSYDKAAEHIVRISRIVGDLKKNLNRMEEYFFHIQERYNYFATPKIKVLLIQKNKIELNESKDLLKRKIKELQDGVKKEKNRSLDFCFDAKKYYDQLKTTVSDTFKLFSTLLNEYETDSLIKMLKVNFKHKANKKSKGESDEDESEHIFDQNFKVYASNYLCGEKIAQLLENIQIVCTWAKEYYESYNDKAKVIFL